MAIIASFPSLGGGRMVIPDYGGVAGTGPATFLNFPMTISDKKPTADGSREGAIWVQTKNLLGEVTKIKITDQTPTEDSEDNILYFVVPSMKSLKMDVHQETGTWKPVEFHYLIGASHQWLAGELDDGSTIRLNLPRLYSKINGAISIENAWYWTGEEWGIASEVGKPFFKETLAVNLIYNDKEYIQKTLPENLSYYNVSSRGDFLIDLKPINSGTTVSNPSSYDKQLSTIEMYKLVNALVYESMGEAVALNAIINFVSELNFTELTKMFISNMVINADATLIAFNAYCYGSKYVDTSLNANYNGYFLFVLEKDVDDYHLKLVKEIIHLDNASIWYTQRDYSLWSILSVDEDFCLFAISGPKIAWGNPPNGANTSIRQPASIVRFDGNDLTVIYQSITSSFPNDIGSYPSRVFDNYLCALPNIITGVIVYTFYIVNDVEIVDTYTIESPAYIEFASYERIGKYGVVTYATKNAGQTGNYIMGLSYDRETLQFVSTGVPVRTADTISNPIDEGFEHPSGKYLSHYSIQKDEALFTINGITLLMGGEAGANFDTETGVITPATTMMDQGVKVYEDTVSRSGQPNIYI